MSTIKQAASEVAAMVGALGAIMNTRTAHVGGTNGSSKGTGPNWRKKEQKRKAKNKAAAKARKQQR